MLYKGFKPPSHTIYRKLYPFTNLQTKHYSVSVSHFGKFNLIYKLMIIIRVQYSVTIPVILSNNIIV